MNHNATAVAESPRTVSTGRGVQARAELTMDLIRRLSEIREARAKELRESDSADHHWWNGEPIGGLADVLESLRNRELEVRNELRKLDGKPPLVSEVRIESNGDYRLEFHEAAESDRSGGEPSGWDVST